MCVGGRLFAGLILLASFGASPCFALESSGEAVAVVQATSAAGPGGTRMLAETQPVYSGDTISTGGAGLAQIRFRDETRLVVGPNSHVVIDRFVLAADTSASGASIRFAKGTFRFITGSGASSNYRLQTPTATVGIRGTEIDISVGGKSGTAVVVYEGAVEVCSRASGQCVIIDSSCSAARVAPGGGVSVPNSRLDRSALINASFPMARNQSALRRGFKVNTGGCGTPQGSPPAKGAPQKASFRAAAMPPAEPEPEPDPKPSKPHKGHHHHHHSKHKDRHDRHHARHDDGRRHGQHADNRRGHRTGEHGRRGDDEGRDGRHGARGGDRSGKGDHGRGAGKGGGHADGRGHGSAGRGGEGRGGDGRGGEGRGGHGASGSKDGGSHSGRGGGGRGGKGDGGGRGGGGGRGR